MKNIFLALILICSLKEVQAQQGIIPINPFDGDTILTNHPAFSWLATTESGFRGTYSFVLVELTDGQNSEEGINSNLSHFRLENVTGSQLMYPFDAPTIREDIWYAWQIQKFSNGVLVDKSEAWKFIISDKSFKEVNKYVSLQRELNGSTYEAINGKVYFKIDEKYYSETLRIEVYDKRMEKVLDEVKNDFSSGVNSGLLNRKTTGTNYYELDVQKISDAGFYTLKVYDSKNQEYNLKFRIR